MFQTGTGIFPVLLLRLESFSVYRYRNNIQLSLNIYNNYNYVTSGEVIRRLFYIIQDVQMDMKDSILIMLFKKKRHRIKSL
jgi:hypothetical protein